MPHRTTAIPLDITNVPVASHFSATAANDVSIKLTTTNDTLIEALFIFHYEGEEACAGMFPQYGRAVIIKKLVELCKNSKTGLFALDNNDAEMVGKELLKMNKLDLYGNQIVDVAPLATLVHLTVLYLCGNQIVDVAPLTTLVHLTSLGLSGNQIVDVAPLATLVNLTVLWLGENQIIDTTPLRSLPETTQIIGVIVRGGCCTIV
jgi:Leucine-rich repeat (LRR) protein